MWTIITENKKGYSLHPETLRWQGKLKALYLRHEMLATEMINRGFKHQSPLDKRKATGIAKQNEFVDSIQDQIQILRKKNCFCKV